MSDTVVVEGSGHGQVVAELEAGAEEGQTVFGHHVHVQRPGGGIVPGDEEAEGDGRGGETGAG